MRVTRRIFLYFFLFSFLILIASGFLGYFYKDNLIKAFVKNANQHLNTKVKPQSIEITIWKDFPHVSLKFNNVKIYESVSGSDNTCIEANNIFVSFNLIDLLQSNYTIQELSIEKGKVNFLKKANGEINYQILKNTGNEARDSSSISLDLNNIALKDIDFSYVDSAQNNAYKGFISKGKAKFHYFKKNWEVGVKGDFDIKGIKIDKLKYFSNKKVTLSSTLTFNSKKQSLKINPSEIKIDNGNFEIKGFYQFKNKDSLDLHFSAAHSSFKSIASLLPHKYGQYVLNYESKGDVYFKGRIKGLTSGKYKPKIMIKFGCNDAFFKHPDYQFQFKKVNLEGKFYNGGNKSLSNGYLSIKNIRGILKDNLIKGDFKLSDFKHPYLKFNVHGKTSFPFIIKFINLKEIKKPKGNLKIDLNFTGPLSAIKKPAKYRNKIQSSGEIQARDLGFHFHKMAYKNFNGNFLFNQNDLSANDFTGKIGSSDFEINGLFKNIFSYLLTKDQPIIINANYKSNFLNLDQILANNNRNKQSDTGKYKFRISPRLFLNLHTNIERIQFRRFNPNNIKGNIRLRDQIAKGKNISMEIAGGKILVNGKLNARNPGYIRADSKVIFRKVSTSKIFYLFENFGQNFLTNNKIEGDINATISSTIVFDENLNIRGPKIKADISTTIFNGRLHDFKPLQSLSTFVDKEALADIHFSRLKNNIHIEHGAIHIPEMEINSNINNMTVRGVHTFDNHFDYHIRLPVKNYKSIDKDAKIATSKDNEGGLNLFLRIKGTPEDLKVSYDKNAVKSKISQRFEEEKKEVKKALKEDPLNKESKKTQELEEEEYFKFEE